MKKTSQLIPCKLCGKKRWRKLRDIKKYKNLFCSLECRNKYRVLDIDSKKTDILKMYKSGKTVRMISKEIGVGQARLGYHFKKWKIPMKRVWQYEQIIKEIGKKKTANAEKNFWENYKSGKISYRTAHKWASRIWKITNSPCEVCGWEEAERDMHLIIPKVLKKNNAVSLCPNHHRLVHRGKIKLTKKI